MPKHAILRNAKSANLGTGPLLPILQLFHLEQHNVLFDIVIEQLFDVGIIGGRRVLKKKLRASAHGGAHLHIASFQPHKQLPINRENSKKKKTSAALSFP
jgi:hypothetical protein